MCVCWGQLCVNACLHVDTDESILRCDGPLQAESSHSSHIMTSLNLSSHLSASQLEADESEKAKDEAYSKEFSDVVDFLKKSLAERVEKVAVSNRWVLFECFVVISVFVTLLCVEKVAVSNRCVVGCFIV